MYYILSLLSGVLIAVMIAINGGLTAEYGLHEVTVFIHLTGLLMIGSVVLLKRERPFAVRHPWFLYMGGAIGVLVVVFNNFAFGRISVSAILALVLLGQGVAGLVIDQYGLFGMPRHPFSLGKLVGLILILVGIVPMLTDFEIVAVAMSFVAGVGVVISRTLNAKLGDLTSVQIGTFFNYFVGLIIALPVYFLLGTGEAFPVGLPITANWYLYIGGFIGVVVITMSNVIVVKIAAFYLTLLIFVGQVFTGILIDTLLEGAFSFPTLLGGVLVSFGLGANLFLDRRREQGGASGGR